MDIIQVQKMRATKGCLDEASLRLKTMEVEIKRGVWGVDAKALRIDEDFARMRKEIAEMTQAMDVILSDLFKK